MKHVKEQILLFVSAKIKNPNIKLLGLNPHSGEGGKIGKEEIDILTPAVKERSLHGKDNDFRNLDVIYFTKDDEFQDEFIKEDSSRWIYKYEDKFSFDSSSIDINWSKSSDGLVLRDIPGDITSIGYQRIQNLNQSFS